MSNPMQMTDKGRAIKADIESVKNMLVELRLNSDGRVRAVLSCGGMWEDSQSGATADEALAALGRSWGAQ